jgi:HSP20 family protein
MVMRFDPFREADRITQEMADRVRETSGSVPMDAYRRGDDVLVHFDLPGVSADSIELTVEQNTLTVRAERYWEPEPDDQILARERRQGLYTRQLLLGEHLDADGLDARYEDGVLTLTIPVAPSAQPKKIKVRSEASHHPDAIDVESNSQESLTGS